MAGIFYGVGVGPGDPELMTCKACRLIRENRVIALPGTQPEETLAYRIAVQSVPELAEKQLLALVMPMTHDRDKMARSHREAADTVERVLEQGENVVFLTLGDPTIYSTFSYVQELVERDGYPTEMVSGVPSFCAAAARVNQPLVCWNEPLHVVPAAHRLTETLSDGGQYVLMKSGRRMKEVKEMLAASGRDVIAVENCGIEGERVYRGVEEIPDDAGYYSLVMAKQPKKK